MRFSSPVEKEHFKSRGWIPRRDVQVSDGVDVAQLVYSDEDNAEQPGLQ